MNVNFLSVLFGAAQLRKQRNLPSAQDITDLDQNAYKKSWLSESDTVDMLQAVRAVYYTTTGEDFYPNAYAEALAKVSAEDAVAGALQRVRTAHPAESPMLNPKAPVRPYWRDVASRLE